jgi:hypothetical protein
MKEAAKLRRPYCVSDSIRLPSQTTENFDLRFTAHSGQFAYRLHFSVALFALAGIADLGHPAMICAKPVGTMKSLLRKTTAR